MSRRRRNPAINNLVLLALPTLSEADRSRLRSIATAVSLGWDETQYRLSDLKRLGLLKKERRTCYFLTDKGEAAVRNLQALADSRQPQNDDYAQRLWNAVRAQRKFALSDIVQLAQRETDIEPETMAALYVSQLEKAEVIQRLPALKNMPARWRLASDLGITAPTMRTGLGVLWDWNADKPVTAGDDA